MNSKNSIWLFLLAFFLLIGVLEIVMWNKYTQIQNEKQKQPSAKTQNSDLVSCQNEDEVSGYDTPAGNTASPSDAHTYLFVGDSRYVAMEEYKESSDTFFCENGVGLSFLKNNMDKIVALADNNTRIIIGLGVNDYLAGTDEYILTFRELSEKTDAEIYYMLINPVDDFVCASMGLGIDNAGINNFNSRIVSGLADSDIKIIDTNSYLMNEGYECGDGLHYDETTTEKIYQYIKASVNN